jgi:hypothetical protein
MGIGGDLDRGTPGGSLLRTYDQRRSARDARVRDRHPRLGGLLLALTDEPATTTNFRRGAEAEVAVARRLLRRCGPEVELLFNRRLSARGRDGDIDVLAVTPNGVHLVDVKRYAGATVRVRATGGLLTPVKQKLLIGGRDRTGLLDSLSRQRDAVRRVIGPDVPLHVSLCFVDADLPWVTERIDGVRVSGGRAVARRMNRAGALDAATRSLLLERLAQQLPAA